MVLSDPIHSWLSQEEGFSPVLDFDSGEDLTGIARGLSKHYIGIVVVLDFFKSLLMELSVGNLAEPRIVVDVEQIRLLTPICREVHRCNHADCRGKSNIFIMIVSDLR